MSRRLDYKRRDIVIHRLTSRFIIPVKRSLVKTKTVRKLKCRSRAPQAEVQETDPKKRLFQNNGYCSFTLLGGQLYRGNWKQNLKNGQGMELNVANEDQEAYEGFFRKDKRDGYGVISHLKPNGVRALTLEGQFVRGLPDGEVDFFRDDYHYLGMVHKGKEHGLGWAWYKDGSFYYGGWHLGVREGTGFLVCVNGNRYEGGWLEDQKHGAGKAYYFDIGTALEGVWQKGLCVTGVYRNIKNRQSASHPVELPLPEVKLKNWKDYYEEWKDIQLNNAKVYRKELLRNKQPNSTVKFISRK